MFKKQIIFLLFSLLPLSSFAKEERSIFTVERINDGAGLVVEDHMVIKLAGLIIPKKYEEQAIKYLEEECLGNEIDLAYGRIDMSRFGEVVAYVNAEDGELIQGKLLKKGYAAAYPDIGSKFSDRLFKAESVAIKAGLGMWSEGEKQIVTPEQAQVGIRDHLNNFTVVEGRVLSVTDTKKRVYINFGEDWRTDFTAAVRKPDLKDFKNIDLTSLKGKNVRLRGWVESRNGPMIRMISSEQIKIVEEDN